MEQERVDYAVFDSPHGHILIWARKGRLIGLEVSKRDIHDRLKALRRLYPFITEAPERLHRISFLLDRYLKGQRIDFDVEVDLSDLPEFTRRVLEETKLIPYGETRSYIDLARRLGYKGAARAVGQALARNPIPLIIPCHRVIRADGTLGGFSLEGITKEWLLKLEGRNRT